MAVQILIKSPNQQVDDIEVKCDVAWSVGQLKDYIYSAYPTKPLQSQQKIIYGGKVLSDHLLLQEVLQKDLNVHTMHLVCPQSTYSNSSYLESHTLGDQAKYSGTGLHTPVQNVVPPASLPDEGLRQRFLDARNSQLNMNAFYSQGQFPQAVGALPMTSPYMAYQMAAMQQTYAQIMSQLLAQSQPGYVNTAAQALPSQTPAQVVAEPAQAIADRAQNAIFEAPNANRQQGEEAEHDFLDSLYIITRVAILVMILYIYSSLEKALLVLWLGLLFYVYQMVANGRQHRRASANQRLDAQRRNNNEANQAPIPTAEIDEEVPNPERSDEDESSNNTATEQPRQSVDNTSFSAVTLIKTFFTSLIPDQPLPVET